MFLKGYKTYTIAFFVALMAFISVIQGDVEGMDIFWDFLSNGNTQLAGLAAALRHGIAG